MLKQKDGLSEEVKCEIASVVVAWHLYNRMGLEYADGPVDKELLKLSNRALGAGKTSKNDEWIMPRIIAGLVMDFSDWIEDSPDNVPQEKLNSWNNLMSELQDKNCCKDGKVSNKIVTLFLSQFFEVADVFFDHGLTIECARKYCHSLFPQVYKCLRGQQTELVFDEDMKAVNVILVKCFLEIYAVMFLFHLVYHPGSRDESHNIPAESVSFVRGLLSKYLKGKTYNFTQDQLDEFITEEAESIVNKMDKYSTEVH